MVGRRMQVYRELLLVEEPQALHQNLIVFGHARSSSKVLRGQNAGICLVEIQEKVVEKGEFVVQRHAGIADLLVELSQGIIRLWRVELA